MFRHVCDWDLERWPGGFHPVLFSLRASVCVYMSIYDAGCKEVSEFHDLRVRMLVSYCSIFGCRCGSSLVFLGSLRSELETAADQSGRRAGSEEADTGA